MSGRGRPSKFSQEIADKIVERLRQGCFQQIAAEESGISVATLKRWLLNGKRFPDSVYAAFLAQVKRALAEAENQAATYLLNHSDWRARAFWLTRARQWWSNQAREVKELQKRLKELESLIRGSQPPRSQDTTVP